MIKKIWNVITNLYGEPLRLTDKELYVQPGVSTAGQCVTEKNVIAISAVFACVRLISQTIAATPLRMYRQSGEIKVLAPEYPLDRIIARRPNVDSTAMTFWQSVVASMLLRDGAYIEVSKVGPNPVSLTFLYRSRLTIEEFNVKKKRYWYTEKTGEQREIPASRIMYIPGFTLDGETGISAIRYGAMMFGSAIAANTAAASTFKNGLLPTVYAKFPTPVKREQREDFRTAMSAMVGALNAGGIPIAEAGASFESIGIDPADAQLLESRNFSVEEICRWFGVPPHMIGHTAASTSWGSGLEQQTLGFLTFTLRPFLTNIKQAVTKDLILPADIDRFTPDYQVDSILELDSTAAGNFYSQMVNNGIMTRDEVRIRKNLEPRNGNADVLTVQTALTPLDNLGQMPNAQP